MVGGGVRTEYIGLCDNCRNSGSHVKVVDGRTVCKNCVREGKA